jgi:hypothetical protein
LKKILPFFSYFFHPLFIAVFATVFYFLMTNRYFAYEIIYLYIIQILLVTVFIPLAIFYLLVVSKKIESMMAPKVAERRIPLIMHIVLLTVLITQSVTKATIPELFYFFLGSMISSCMALILVFCRKKASLHMLGMASLTIFCIASCIHFQTREVLIITLLLFCNGLVASSRLFMKAHTANELVIGYVIGLLPQLFLLFLWL